MSAQLNPYISFRGNAREAMEFYRSVFGGDLVVSTFGEFRLAGPERRRQGHALAAGDPRGLHADGADTPPGMEITPGDNNTVSLSGDDSDKLRGYWEKLSAEGKVSTPLAKQMWGDEFGSCQDRFGINWLVNIAAPGTPGGAPST